MCAVDGVTEDVTVVVVDDHAPTRLGIRMALQGTGFAVVGEAADADGAVDLARELVPQVCLVDVHMPGNGIAAAEGIRRASPGTVVVMLTVSADETDLFAAIRAGASGYLLKDIDPDRLPHALRGVLEGEAALPRPMVTRLMAELRKRDARRVNAGARLTNREWEILDLLAQGLTTADVAERLFVSTVTIRSHVSATLHKLHVPDRESAIRVFRDRRS